jgi:hypothetical protein
MISLLVYVLVVCLIAGLAYWLLDTIPVPEPINRIAKILIVVIAAIALIYVLLGLAGGDMPRLR